ncbi:RNA polymerase II mediator complex component [Fusarium napiforme]|uniref:RNA polymerase II mediator complex component n=1 Tax=Fusarium napiforme TaxID=42672 RepID=A0A8H5MWW5_9HYPO|nr:RNA polymerase II mediator complex component [Fusarium napiforme]
MGRKTKQRSCFACVETKRRCDKRYPSCSRCLDRESVCVYPPLARRQPLDLIEAEKVPNMGFGDVWTAAADANSLALLGEISEPWLLDPVFSASLNCPSLPSWTPSLSDPSSLPASSSSGIPEASNQLTHTYRDLGWFLGPQSWTIGYHYNAPDVIPPASVFTNFIRGLQNWLSRFVKTGHNPFIHRHLYSDSGHPQCIQDAYSACVISSAASSENETIVNTISATHITNLLKAQPARDTSIISTRDHLARTQALLIHILLALTLASPLSIMATSSGTAVGELDPVPGLYRSFILSESISRTGLLCNMATGVYSGLIGSNIQSCGGDIHITAQAKFWEASSSARWEAVARQTDPLFIYSLKGQMLLDRGIGAAQVDEFARHLFTIMWGLEKVETWAVRTGDEISVVY